MKFDGSNWVPDKERGGLFTIWGFNNNDLWVAGNSVEHFDGQNWIGIDFVYIHSQIVVRDTILFNNIPYLSIWGTGSDNLFLGNLWGKIIHWNGNKGSVMNFQSVEAVRDIWGISENNIYAATGTIDGNRNSELYHFDGTSWNLVIKGSISPGSNELTGPFYSVWTYDNTELYAAGGTVAKRIGNQWSEDIVGFIVHDLKGDKPNNIFAVGSYGNVIHYNGNDWYSYKSQLNNGIHLRCVFVIGNDVFMGGWDGTTAAYIIHGNSN